MKTANSNGEYRFDPQAVRVGLVAATILLLLFGSLGIWSGTTERFSSKGSILSLTLCLVIVAALVHIGRLSGRKLQVSDDGISVRDKRGHQIGSLRWAELAKVTERRRMAQLALWDKSGARRVLVDQQFENFAMIRSRILTEYAKVFAIKPLPIRFRNSSPLLLETIIFGSIAAFWTWGGWRTYQQGQTALSVILFGIAIVSILLVLNLYPQIAGPSVLSEDRIVLRTLFKTQEITRANVASVELSDMANPHSGTKFSFVALKTIDGKLIRITSKFGSIPEMYLTLRAWLSQSNA